MQQDRSPVLAATLSARSGPPIGTSLPAPRTSDMIGPCSLLSRTSKPSKRVGVQVGGSPSAGATRPSPGRRQGLTVHRVSGSPCYPTLRHSPSSRRIFGILNFGHYGNPASPLFLKDGNSKGCPSTMGWYVVHMTLLRRAAPMDVTRRHQPHRDVAVRERPAHSSVRCNPLTSADEDDYDQSSFNASSVVAHCKLHSSS